ncbi:MAG: YIP1 family protein [Candidatus Aenigmatarchaeota archaeon]
MAFWNQWAGALANPVKEFRKAMYKANLASALFHMMFPALVMGVVTYFASLSIAALNLGVLILIALLSGISVIIGWLLWSAIVFILSKIVDGRGGFVTQSYMMALYTAPLTIVGMLVSMLPLGGILTLVILLYSLYLLFVAVQIVHGFDTRKSVTIVVLSLLLVFFLLITVSTIFRVFAVVS